VRLTFDRGTVVLADREITSIWALFRAFCGTSAWACIDFHHIAAPRSLPN